MIKLKIGSFLTLFVLQKTYKISKLQNIIRKENLIINIFDINGIYNFSAMFWHINTSGSSHMIGPIFLNLNFSELLVFKHIVVDKANELRKGSF